MLGVCAIIGRMLGRPQIYIYIYINRYYYTYTQRQMYIYTYIYIHIHINHPKQIASPSLSEMIYVHLFSDVSHSQDVTGK